MNPDGTPGLVVAVHPTSKGFGWVVFEGPLAPVDWGIATAKVKRSATSMRKFTHLLNQYHPSVVVLEQFDGEHARRGARIQDLARSMMGSAANREIEVAVYSRELVGRHVAGDIHATRHAIAQAVSKCIPILRFRLPQARALWQSEDPRQCLFDAAALAITHFAVSRPPR
jgi:Holliday junction resolvasome RuvABC endonuclease subunit